MVLVGRTRELARLHALNAAGTRLVTLWGPGGVGKTSLLRAFEEEACRTSPDAVLFCNASESRTDQDVQRAVARALRVDRIAGDTPDEAALIDTLRLRSPLLLLIDSFEQVAAISDITVGAWLNAVPGLRALVTSREPLAIPGEVRVCVDGLAATDAEALFRSLAARMEADPSDTQTIARIVTRLDGLPLAIELAAARLDVLGPKELADRLESSLDVLGVAPSSSLRATVQWSWDLLSEQERRALACLSTFRNGFEPAVAEAMLAVVDPGVEPLDVLSSLRRKSLLHVSRAPGATSDRLCVYQAVKEFADAQLDPLGLRATANQSHASALLDRTRTWLGQLYGGKQAEALEGLASEAENLIAIVERFALDAPAVAAQAVLTLHPLLLVRGPFEPHLALLDDLLNRTAQELDGAIRAKLLLARGEVRRVRGAVAHARQDLERARELAGESGDGLTQVECCQILGSVARMEGALEEALVLKNLAVEGYEKYGERARQAIALGELGTVLASLGQLHEAAQRHRAALDLHRAHGNARFEGVELSYLGVALHRAGDVTQALEIHQRALSIHREVGNVRSEAGDCCHIGYLLHQLSKFDEARSYFERAMSLCERVSDRHLAAVVQT